MIYQSLINTQQSSETQTDTEAGKQTDRQRETHIFGPVTNLKD